MELTNKQIEIIQLCHHDFDGLTVEQAAKKLGCSKANVYDLLAEAEKAAPQMFPILTPRQRVILCLYSQEKVNRAVVTAGLDISMSTLEREVTWLREHGHLSNKPDQYCAWMDDKVKEVF